MYDFESGRLVNKQVEQALQEAQDVLNLVDVLARATGDFINSCGKGEFSENVSNWLFEKKQSRALSNAIRAGRGRCVQPESSSATESRSEEDANEPSNENFEEQLRRREAEIRERIFQPQFSLSRSYDGLDLPSSYYSSQLLSHHVSSNNAYKPARSRYLEQDAAELFEMRQRLNRLNSAPATSQRSACDLVGPISGTPKSKAPARTSGVAVTLSSGSYANVRSCIAKSKQMFDDFTGPNNPNYQCPWERDNLRGRARFALRRH